MGLFRRRERESVTVAYDPETEVPAIRSSICTGEKIAGFQNKESGKFSEVMLIRTNDDLIAFRARYGIDGDILYIY